MTGHLRTRKPKQRLHSGSQKNPPYFREFEDVVPPDLAEEGRSWHLFAGLTIGLGIWYLYWRWTASLNPDAMVFSVLVAAAESALFVGTLLFFHDIWEEGDTPVQPAPQSRSDLALDGDEPILVDVFITTYDEDLEVVRPSAEAAKGLICPEGIEILVHLLDDGCRAQMANLASSMGLIYHARTTNLGFKAGNLHNALTQSRGDFIVICDADTRLFPSMVANTLGYFRDEKVAWVQTPHWFYDIPSGEQWGDWLSRQFGNWAGRFRQLPELVFGTKACGRDPFASDPVVFFDVIQRRRNRSGASFCCGAGSIHRREALFQNALMRTSSNISLRKRAFPGLDNSMALASERLEPFSYHVSEDLLTSLHLHSAGWTSVFHPRVEAKMLSPWSVRARLTQQKKYAHGTLDILVNRNPIFRSGLPVRMRLHYAATFWSYLSFLWLPLLIFAPMFSMLTAISPVESYSASFFFRLVPLLISNEIAIYLACKGYDTHRSHAHSILVLPFQLSGIWRAVRGKVGEFKPTPKLPIGQNRTYLTEITLVLIAMMFVSALWGVVAAVQGRSGYTTALVVVNLFWMAWNAKAIVELLKMSLWTAPQKQCAASRIHSSSYHLQEKRT